MGESLSELHSTIISRDVTARHAVARTFRAWRIHSNERGERALLLVQDELDEAGQDKDQQGGGNCHIQRIAHTSPGHQRCGALILIN